MNNYSGMQSGVLISFNSYFSSVFENSMLFSGVVGMGFLRAMQTLRLLVSAILECKLHFFNTKLFFSFYR